MNDTDWLAEIDANLKAYATLKKTIEDRERGLREFRDRLKAEKSSRFGTSYGPEDFPPELRDKLTPKADK